MILNKGAGAHKAVSLGTISQSGTYMVESISGPEKQRLRLNELGIVAGMPVAVMDCSSDGMLVLRVGGARMALSKGSSDHIWVKPRHADRLK